MSERYSRLFTLSENLYTEGSPVVIAAGTLLKDNQNDKIIAQLKFKSISDRIIIAVKVHLDLFDTAGNPLEEMVDYEYLDLKISRDAEFGQKNPVPVPEKTRSYVASATEVIFADKSAWNVCKEKWEELRKPVLLPIDDPELLKQYKLHFGITDAYVPTKDKDLWLCTCGKWNRLAEHDCHACGTSLRKLKALDLNELAVEKDKRKSAEKHRKIKIAGLIAALLVLVILITQVIVPFFQQKKITSLMEEGKFDEAIEMLDSPEHPFGGLYEGKSRESVRDSLGKPKYTGAKYGNEDYDISFLGAKGNLGVWYDSDNGVSHAYWSCYGDDSSFCKEWLVDYFTSQYGKPESGYYEYNWSITKIFKIGYTPNDNGVSLYLSFG